MTDLLPFEDRRQAGQVLAERLAHHRGRPGLLVLALPRGGVPVAFEVALALSAPLDIFMVRKLGFPGHEEYAIGAIASGTTGSVRVMSDLSSLAISPDALAAVVAREEAELARRERLYRGQWPATPLQGRAVIVVDDGLATGATMRAALLAIRQQQPAHLVAAVPVGAAESCRELQGVADEVICAAMPEPFRAVGRWYRHFGQTSDEEVQALLEEARRLRPVP
jgi:putative phosphoribosyl transferase